jgi:hypothetical protein
LHKARELPKEEFKREVSKRLTGKDTEPWEILYFRAWRRGSKMLYCLPSLDW